MRFAALNAEAERRQREFLVDGDWLSEAMPQRWAPRYADLAHEYTARRNALRNPMQLLFVDEADRLTTVSLEQLHDLFDHGHFGLVLIGMPGRRSDWWGMPSSTRASGSSTSSDR